MLYEVIFIFLKILMAAIFGLFFMGIMRKLAARLQQRVGPPIWQPFLDLIKLLSKENIKSKRENPYLAWGPIISLSAYVSIIMIIPISGFPDIYTRGSIIYVIYLLLMGLSGYIISGFSSGSPYGNIGGSREIIQSFGFELPFIIALLVPALSTLTITEGTFLFYPFAFIAFIISVQGELQLPPFHIPHAEQEIVSGVTTEISGFKLGLFELAYAFKLFALSSLVSILFLGGGNFIFFILKTFGVVILLTVIRMLFARMTIEQGLKFMWLVASPLAIIDMVKMMLIL